MTTKSKTKKTTSRKGSATRRDSEAVQRYKQARKDAEHSIDAAGEDSPHYTAGRITLLLTDEETALSTSSAIQRAIEDLAELTGISVSHPTVVCETYPAMLAAVNSGEVWNSTTGETAKARHTRLLKLLTRAEDGEVLDAPEEPHTNKHTDIPMQEIDEDEAAELAEEISGGADDYDPERKALIRLVCGIAAIKDEEYRHGVAADVARIIFLNLSSIEKEVGHFVARLYAEDEQKGGAR
jgi:hypothetical protein